MFKKTQPKTQQFNKFKREIFQTFMKCKIVEIMQYFSYLKIYLAITIYSKDIKIVAQLAHLICSKQSNISHNRQLLA